MMLNLIMALLTSRIQTRGLNLFGNASKSTNYSHVELKVLFALALRACVTLIKWIELLASKPQIFYRICSLAYSSWDLHQQNKMLLKALLVLLMLFILV